MTMALEELASRGHDWNDLLDGYSVGLVQNLCRAGRENTRRQLIEHTVGLSVAVSNAIDLAFGGKGKTMELYIEALNKTDIEQPGTASGKNVLTDRARQIFRGLPMRKGKQ